jgi:5'-nucleotidase
MLVARRPPIRLLFALFIASASLGGADCKRATPPVPAHAPPTTSASATSGSVAPLGGAPAKALGAPVEITIVGTADVHGRLGPLPRFGAFVRALREARPGRVVVVDSGDIMQGTLDSDLNEGQAVIDAYRAIGFDAVAIGNHEFDYGPTGPNPTPQHPSQDPRGALKARTAQSMGAFPWLSANLSEGSSAPAWPNVRPSTIVDLASGVRVGLIGVTTEDTPRVTIAANFRGLAVHPLADSITREAKSLRNAGAHVVVVLAHAGGKCRSFRDPDDLSSCDRRAEIFAVARALAPGTVDAILAGHTHHPVAHRVNGIPIAQGRPYGRAFARIDLTYDPNLRRVTASRLQKPVSLRKKVRTYEGRPLVEDERVAAIAASAKSKADARRNEALAVELDGPMRRRYGEESALGNFVASMILDVAPRANIALYNGGGLRANLPSGRLSYGSLYDVLPFDNRLAIVTMKGRDLRSLFARNLRARFGILSLAGGRVEARCRESELEVDVLLERPRSPGLQGAPAAVRDTTSLVALRDDEDVVVATNDFLAMGGDGFPRIGSTVVPNEGETLRDQIAARLRRQFARIEPRKWLDRASRRIRLPSRRPIRCFED